MSPPLCLHTASNQRGQRMRLGTYMHVAILRCGHIPRQWSHSYTHNSKSVVNTTTAKCNTRNIHVQTCVMLVYPSMVKHVCMMLKCICTCTHLLSVPIHGSSRGNSVIFEQLTLRTYPVMCCSMYIHCRGIYLRSVGISIP